MQCQLCVNFFLHFFTRNIVQSLVMNKSKPRLKASAKASMSIAIDGIVTKDIIQHFS